MTLRRTTRIRTRTRKKSTVAFLVCQLGSEAMNSAGLCCSQMDPKRTVGIYSTGVSANKAPREES